MHIDTYEDFYKINKAYFYNNFKDNLSPFGNILSSYNKNEGPTVIQELQLWYELPLANLWGGNVFRSYFTICIADIISDMLKKPVVIENNDIYINDTFVSNGITLLKGKLSHSAMKLDSDMVIGYIDIYNKNANLVDNNAYSMNLSPNDIQKLEQDITKCFYNINKNIYSCTQRS